MVLVVPSVRTIFAPSGRIIAVAALVVKFTPLRVRVLSIHLLSAAPSVFAALSSASAVVGLVMKSAVTVGVAGSSSASTVIGSSVRHSSRESRS